MEYYFSRRWHQPVVETHYTYMDDQDRRQFASEQFEVLIQPRIYNKIYAKRHICNVVFEYVSYKQFDDFRSRCRVLGRTQLLKNELYAVCSNRSDTWM
jgi:hypothetical protein